MLCCVKCDSLLYNHVVILILDLINDDKTINRRALGRKVFGNKVIRLGHGCIAVDFESTVSCLTFNKDTFYHSGELKSPNKHRMA